MLKIYSGTIRSKTAGLSPHDDERVELFFAGCKMAREGHPCPGCFNQDLWYDTNVHEQTPQEVVEYIISMTDNKYITIVGGEPMDQAEGLLELVKLLQEKHFHIVLISHYTIDEIIEMKYGRDILKHVNLLIDGKYEADKRIFDTDMRPGILHVVGSSNQRLYYKVNLSFLPEGFFDVSHSADLRAYYYKEEDYNG